MDTCAKYNGFQAGDNEICFECRIKRGDGFRKTSNYEKVQFYGHYSEFILMILILFYNIYHFII